MDNAPNIVQELNDILRRKPIIPPCCRNCYHFDWDAEEFKGTTYYYCSLNIFFPTKQQTCKKQKPIEQSAEAAHE